MRVRTDSPAEAMDIIWGKHFLGSFQTLRLRLLSPATSGQARPYVSRVQLGEGGRAGPTGQHFGRLEAGFVEQGSG